MYHVFFCVCVCVVTSCCYVVAMCCKLAIALLYCVVYFLSALHPIAMLLLSNSYSMGGGNYGIEQSGV